MMLNPVIYYYYRIAGNFGGRKFGRIWRIAEHSPKFPSPNLPHAVIFNGGMRAGRQN